MDEVRSSSSTRGRDKDSGSVGGTTLSGLQKVEVWVDDRSTVSLYVNKYGDR